MAEKNLNILVCVKQVPDSHNVKVDRRSGLLLRTGETSIMNPDDAHAMELAVSLRERYGGEVVAMTMGPDHASDVLYEACALGADHAVLVTDERFAGSDSYVTGKILSRSIEHFGKFDIIITGVEAIDGSTASVGFHIAEFLGITLLRQVHRIDIIDGSVEVERLCGHEFQKVRVKLPVIIAANKETNSVRFPSLSDISSCYEKHIHRISMEDIGGKEEEYGLKGSPTIVVDSESFSHRRGREKIEGTTEEKAEALIHEMKRLDILKF